MLPRASSATTGSNYRSALVSESDRVASGQVRIVSISSIARWADAVIALDARGPLPGRIVLVPSEAHAHALRVELVARGPHVLAGTQFFTAAAAARAVLDSAGVAYRIGEEVRR